MFDPTKPEEFFSRFKLNSEEVHALQLIKYEWTDPDAAIAIYMTNRVSKPIFYIVAMQDHVDSLEGIKAFMERFSDCKVKEFVQVKIPDERIKNNEWSKYATSYGDYTFLAKINPSQNSYNYWLGDIS